MRRSVLALAAAWVALSSPAANAQPGAAVLFDDYGLTGPLTNTARAAAMCGAVVSTTNDVQSLRSNPAGLARIKRIEISLGLQQERTDVNNTFFGTSTGVDTRAGGFESAALAFPMPTYRGSFVAAFGVYRVYSGYLDLHYSGVNGTDETRDNYLLQQSGAIYSYDAGIGVDLSPTLSGGVSLFVLDGTIDPLEQYDFYFTSPMSGVSVYVSDDRNIDVDGFGARVGAQLYFHRRLRAGFMFQTPTVMNIAGPAYTEITENVDNGVDTFTQSRGSVDSDLVLPYTVQLGVSTIVFNTTISLQMDYADWTEAAIDRKRLRAKSLEPVFREVVDYRAGLEWTAPKLPMRVRAGFAWLPYPMRYMHGDRIDGKEFVRATIVDERRQVSFGVGGLVGQVMTIDAAYIHTSGTRTAAALTDERVMERFLLTASYRF